ncbi:ribonuclease HII [Clostridium tarantellae]|uniref:Ribonuclease HII n=1 Tax=Clostridium tarantellae TaxID=39493 RepID=A0A6I1MG94_9CLOT|nr:ribonuclease HII [Clostridium tarantellae]MPQ42395.1 ribonuclease HII [Clostridium tarantellae]
MKELVKDLKENISSYSFKKVNELIGKIEVNKDNKDDLLEISLLLNKDKRKNIISLGDKIQRHIERFTKEYLRVKAMYEFDKSFGEFNFIAGVDEVGRGPLAGPIVSCAVILNLDDLEDLILEINDSKVISEAKREYLSEIIKKKAISYSIACSSNDEIDIKGIAYCNNKVFIDACNGLSVKPDLVLSDGYLIKNFNIQNKSVIKGDKHSATIACASIVAKVYRDNLMKEYHKKYPQYQFDKNMGYGTKNHVEALKVNGMTSIHRKTFLNNILQQL